VITKNLADVIHSLRWFSALTVVLSHARRLIFTPYSELVDPSIAVSIFYSLTGYGHEAVLVFFVLSGYLVGGKVIEQIVDVRFDLLKYVIARVSRLYIVYVPAIFLTSLIAFLVGSMDLDSWYVDSASTGHLGMLASSDVSNSTLIKNLLMLQDLFVSVYGQNIPLWSLSYEFWFYVIFPLPLLMLTGRPLGKVLILLSLVLCVCFMPLKFWFYFIIWVFGAVAAVVTAVSKKQANLATGGFFLLGLFISIVVSRFNLFDLHYSVTDAFIGAFIAFLLFWLRCRDDVIIVSSKFHEFYAGFSYSLYLIHYPILVIAISLLNKFGYPAFSVQLNFQTFIVYLCMVLFSNIVAYIFYFLFERHSLLLRRNLESALTRLPPVRL